MFDAKHARRDVVSAGARSDRSVGEAHRGGRAVPQCDPVAVARLHQFDPLLGARTADAIDLIGAAIRRRPHRRDHTEVIEQRVLHADADALALLLYVIDVLEGELARETEDEATTARPAARRIVKQHALEEQLISALS